MSIDRHESRRLVGTTYGRSECCGHTTELIRKATSWRQKIDGRTEANIGKRKIINECYILYGKRNW